jgi:hypothetical protein
LRWRARLAMMAPVEIAGRAADWENTMLRSVVRTIWIGIAIGLAFPAAAGMVGKLAKPSDPVILTVTGNIAATNGDQAASFDRKMLEAMGTTRIVTHTPWTEGEVDFEGVRLDQLLTALGAEGTQLRAVAANDYAVEIPIEELRRYPAILAMSMNGERLRLRDKGPLWIIYPWAEHPEIDNNGTHPHSVWQLKALHVQ